MRNTGFVLAAAMACVAGCASGGGAAAHGTGSGSGGDNDEPAGVAGSGGSSDGGHGGGGAAGTGTAGTGGAGVPDGSTDTDAATTAGSDGTSDPDAAAVLDSGSVPDASSDTGAGGTGGCAGDPRAGWTEFMDTFTVQHPYDLQPADRFTFQDGVYTLWVFPNDKPHAVGNTTAPRTEMRWSNWTTGERMWEADMMFESPLNHTCVMQIHNVGAAIAAYMQVNAGDMRNAAGGGTILKGSYGKWFNMKVAFNPDTHTVRTWIDNCLVGTTKAPNGPDPNWYFKNGVYTCNATICRDHFKNIRFWKH